MERGGAVKKGERGCPIVFWKWHQEEENDAGEIGHGRKPDAPVLRYYTVFNVEQCEGVPSPAVEARSPFETLPGTDESRPAQLVLLAMGFVGPEPELLDGLGVDRDPRGNVDAPEYATSVPGVFAAGDARRGQSLIVWAIEEGRRCAVEVDRRLLSRSSA